MSTLLSALTVPELMKLGRCIILPAPASLSRYISQSQQCWLTQGAKAIHLFEEYARASRETRFSREAPLFSLSDRGQLVNLCGRCVDNSLMQGRFTQLVMEGDGLLLLSTSGAVIYVHLSEALVVTSQRTIVEGGVRLIVGGGTYLTSNGRAGHIKDGLIPGIYSYIADLYFCTALVTRANHLRFADLKSKLIRTRPIRLKFTPRQITLTQYTEANESILHLLSSTGEIYRIVVRDLLGDEYCGGAIESPILLDLPISASIYTANYQGVLHYLTLQGEVRRCGA